MVKNAFAALKTKLCFSLVVTILAGLPLSVVKASVIGSFEINGSFGARAIFNQIHISVDFGGDYVEMTPGGVAIDLVLSKDNVGQTYTVLSGNEFEEAVVYLTNGINDPVSFEYMSSGGDGGGGGGLGANEAYFFFGDITGANGIDFSGYDINSISLAVNSLSFNSSFDWTDVIFNATATIEGSPVPLPGAIWLFASGLAGFFGFRKNAGVSLSPPSK